MIHAFFGLTLANLILLGAAFFLGPLAMDDVGDPSRYYIVHLSLGISAGFVTLLTHMVIYIYFMATSKWLAAATDKADLPLEAYVAPSTSNKRQAFFITMGPIALTMAAMFAGAGADPAGANLWTANVHYFAVAIAISANMACAFLEYRLIQRQGKLMDGALATLNDSPDIVVEQPIAPGESQ